MRSTSRSAFNRYDFDEVIRIPNSIFEIAGIRDKVVKCMEKYAYSSSATMNVAIALEEAMANAIEHGSTWECPIIEVAFKIDENCSIFQVTDFGGIGFNPEYFEKLADIKDWGKGGRGIFLIKRLMDEVYYLFNPHKATVVVMIKYGSNFIPRFISTACGCAAFSTKS